MEGDGSKVVKLGLHEAGGSSLFLTLLYPLVLLLLEVVKRSPLGKWRAFSGKGWTSETW